MRKLGTRRTHQRWRQPLGTALSHARTLPPSPYDWTVTYADIPGQVRVFCLAAQPLNLSTPIQRAKLVSTARTNSLSPFCPFHSRYPPRADRLSASFSPSTWTERRRRRRGGFHTSRPDLVHQYAIAPTSHANQEARSVCALYMPTARCCQRGDGLQRSYLSRATTSLSQ